MHPVALTRRVGPHRRLAVGAEAADDQVAKVDEALEQRAAPGLGSLGVVLGDGDHRPDPTPTRAAVESGCMERLGAVLERPPAADPVVAELEEPGHDVLACGRAVLVPCPDPSDQRHREPPPDSVPSS